MCSARSVDAAAVENQDGQGPDCSERDRPGSEPGILESERVKLEGNQ